ncbi:hypothetical protein CTAYLR_000183 [Chrysophaeum taylorii]|uniref:DUS-like FMN-binding domain-containing protein n=1 Tax=Chrysophaeum taylorii TaxID=2483200 RepID=A0AAD7UE64_9STRA|nr:hypothetical protein CTAYLR_000183 [Chrysophaeum taylorii]
MNHEEDPPGRRLILLLLQRFEAQLRKLVGQTQIAAATIAGLRSIIVPSSVLYGFRVPLRGLAPMVGASELAYRMLTREAGSATATWSPMIDASGYARSEQYRAEHTFDDRDAPCVAQLGGRSPEDVEVAAELLATRHRSIRAVELNVGCPQRCARLGRYGAFLLSEPNHLVALVRALDLGVRRSGRLDVVAAVKIRVYRDNYAKTVALVDRLVDAGARLVTVHGRARQQRDCDSADWEIIRRIKQGLRGKSVLLVANGDVRDLAAMRRCLSYTRADGVMAARALLRDPACLSRDKSRRPIDHARLYLSFVRDVGAPPPAVRRHLAAMLEREFRRVPQCRKPIMAFRGAVQSGKHGLVDDDSALEALFRALDNLATARSGSLCCSKNSLPTLLFSDEKQPCPESML